MHELATTNNMIRYADRYICYIDRTQKTTETYLTNLKQFFAYLAFNKISEPQRQDIINYRDWLMNEHIAIQFDKEAGFKYRMQNGKHYFVTCRATTTKMYLQTVKQFFNWLSAEGLYQNIADNVHAPKLTNEQHRKQALTAEVVKSIGESINSNANKNRSEITATKKDLKNKQIRATEQELRLDAMYWLAVTAGLRTVELSRLNNCDVKKQGNVAFLNVQGKGHSEADTRVYIAIGVYDKLQNYMQVKGSCAPSAPLFVSTGNRSGGKRIEARTIGRMLKKAMIEAGYNDNTITAHSLRHTAGTAVMKLTNNNIYETQNYMRHHSPLTTERYLHVENDKRNNELAEASYKRYL